MKIHQQIVAIQTLTYKEVRRFMRIWVQTLLPPAITTTLYFLIFGKFIGSQIGEIQGFAYIDYIVPGLILMMAITNSYNNVASSFYSNKFQRNIEELLISPMPNYLIVIGYALGGTLRGVMVSIIVFMISFLFTQLPIPHPLYALTVLILTSSFFALAGLINGIFAKSFDDISIIPSFVLTPLTYLGGVFYSLSFLPEFWRDVSLLNPIVYMVNGFRYGLLGVGDVSPALALLTGVLFTLLLLVLCLYLLARGTGIRQ